MALTAIETITSLCSFTGSEGEDVEKFFRQLERLFNQAQYNDERKAEILPFSLKKKALDFYDNLSDVQKNNYATVKEAIVNHFKQNKSEFIKWRELNRLKKRSDQTVAEFYDNLRYRAGQLNGISEDNLLNIFMNGLDKNLRNKIATHEPLTLNLAKEKARLFESLEANDDKESFVISNKQREETEAEYYVENGEQKAKFYLRDQEAYFLKTENENLRKSYENKMIEMEDIFQKKLKEKDEELTSIHKSMGEELRGLYYLLESM